MLHDRDDIAQNFLAAGLLKTMNEMKKKLSNQKGKVVVIQKVQTCLTNLCFHLNP